MGDIKNVIGYLCKYINLLLDWDTDDLMFRPEFFRLARHNKIHENIVYRFWLLLSKLEIPKLHLITNVSMIARVKLFFAFKNYKGVDFYLLPEDCKYGSRELLLALAWLIGNTNILTLLVEKKLAKSSVNYEFPEIAEDINVPEKLCLSSNVDITNYISLLIGKISLHLKSHDDCSKKLIENMKKIHCATKYDIDIPHLSVNDVYLARYPQEGDMFLEKNAMTISLLEAKVKWEQCQGTFWKWMSTVLTDKINDKSVNGSKKEEADTLMNFIDLLKTEIHVKPENIIRVQSPISIGNNLKPITDIERHVFLTKGCKSGYTGFIFEESAVKTKHCDEVLKEFENLRGDNIRSSSLQLAREINDKLKFLLNTNELNAL